MQDAVAGQTNKRSALMEKCLTFVSHPGAAITRLEQGINHLKNDVDTIRGATTITSGNAFLSIVAVGKFSQVVITDATTNAQSTVKTNFLDTLEIKHAADELTDKIARKLDKRVAYLDHALPAVSEMTVEQIKTKLEGIKNRAIETGTATSDTGIPAAKARTNAEKTDRPDEHNIEAVWPGCAELHALQRQRRGPGMLTALQTQCTQREAIAINRVQTRLAADIAKASAGRYVRTTENLAQTAAAYQSGQTRDKGS